MHLYKYWQGIVGGGIVLLVISTILPVQNAKSLFLADYAIEILLGTLLVGGIAFLTGKRLLMALSFLSAIALCVFLKDAQNNDFMYANASDNAKIRAAHFSFLDTQGRKELINYLPSVDAEIISLQVPLDERYETELRAKLESRYEHTRSVRCGNDFGVLLFSAMPIDNLDTLNEGDAICLSASIWIDSLDRKLNLVSMYLPEDDYSEQHYQKLGYQVKHCSSERPTLTFSNIQERAWSNKIQSFKTSAAVNDSRMDLDWNPARGSIFYSDLLHCIGFKEIFDGRGVLGVYEFKPAPVIPESYSQTYDFSGDLTMF